MNTIKVFEAFSGYGSQSIALRNIGVPFKVVAISEIDKYAIKAYEAIHGDVINLGDISKIELDKIPKHDLFTYSFPCQDISVAGKGLGLDKDSGTRSGLLWECEKIIRHSRPKYLLMENVKNLINGVHKENFYAWCNILKDLGYTNSYKVINSKDFGVPQSRNRIFMVSILGSEDCYKFPDGFSSNKKIKDILESSVDEKYYLKNEIQQRFSPVLKKDFMNRDIIRLGNASLNVKSQAGSIVSIEGISMTICSGSHGYSIGYIYDGKLDMNNLTVGKGLLRRYTPRECFRLQGLSDSEIDKIQELGISDTQQYKLAGNSITVQVLEHIFKNLFCK